MHLHSGGVYRSSFSNSPVTTHTSDTQETRITGNLNLGKPKGRKPLWSPHSITESELLRGRQILARYGDAPNEKSRAKRRSDFREFYNLNSSLDTKTLMTGLLGQMSEVLDASTVQNYFQIFGLVGGKFPQGFVCDSSFDPFWFSSTIAKFHADNPGSHASDLTIDILKDIITRTSQTGYLAEAAALEVILKTGLRSIDLHRLRLDSLQIGAKALRFTLCWTKGIRRRQHRRHLRIPLWFGTLTKGAISSAKALITVWRQKTETLRSLGRRGESLACHLNRCVKKACGKKAKASSAERSPTTYSFRRAFIRKALSKCGGDAVLCAAKYTAHRNPDILLAHYQTLENLVID